MTVQELYNWAVENNATNLEVRILYRDGGGFYSGYDDNLEPEVCQDRRMAWVEI